MLNSLLGKYERKFNSLAKKKASQEQKENKAVEEFMQFVDSETMNKVFEIIEKKGHPKDVIEMDKIRKRYSQGTQLEFNEVMSLANMYKANICNSSNKIDEVKEYE